MRVEGSGVRYPGLVRLLKGVILLLLLLYSRTGPRRALSLKLSDTRVYEPEKRTRLGRKREVRYRITIYVRGTTEELLDTHTSCSTSFRSDFWARFI